MTAIEGVADHSLECHQLPVLEPLDRYPRPIDQWAHQA